MANNDQHHRAEILVRRREELEALRAFFGEQLLPCLPSNISTAKNGGGASDVPIDGPWFIQLISGKSPFVPTLEVRLSSNYPLISSNEESPTPILHNVDYHMNPRQKDALIAGLKDMYEPEMHMDVGILWAERCREEFVDVSVPSCDLQSTDNLAVDVVKESSNNDPIELSVMFLSFNHLLHGKSHKKEAQIVSLAYKMGLVGFVSYGTPGLIGVIVCKNKDNTGVVAGITTTAGHDVVDFSKECSRIGKKGTILDVSLELDENGLKRQQGEIAMGVKKSCQHNQSTRSRQKQVTGIHCLLVDLLGEDKVVCSKRESKFTQQVLVVKKGLNSFPSRIELKKVLVDRHDMNDKIFQQIIGVA
ncbi:hypothetical protein HJC23_002156 [Cyclotella cryptica]|uniref:RWD domain-containing protein n=1 Tax=Cyclotella cryptica TaxID=29204 RepID=A0ABD3QCJ2_9STRA|eukprot:CCRYP_008170-RA/>CCRYP_008170-RA protein AED:0.00 eAED:0.00 QI:90/-1/1/1/-1/1/1/169/360